MLSSHSKIIIGVILFSLSPILVAILTLNVVSILWTVHLIGSVALFLKIVFQQRSNEFKSLLRSNFLLLFGLAIAATINNVLFFQSVKSTTIANAVLTHYLAPIFLLFFSVYLFKEKIERNSIIALLLSLLGLVVLLLPQELSLTNTHFIGLLLGSLSAIFFATDISMRKKLSQTYNADTVAASYLFISALILLPFISFSSIIQVNFEELAALLVFGIIIVGFGVSIHTSGLRDTKAQRVGILNYIEPLGAILWSILFLTETLSASVFIGGALILSGGYLVVRKSTTEE